MAGQEQSRDAHAQLRTAGPAPRAALTARWTLYSEQVPRPLEPSD